MSEQSSERKVPPPEHELSAFDGLTRLIGMLRDPGGCPWDREQTHESLKRNLLEETYEVLEAIDRGDWKGLSEELGDILVQVAFHADIGRRAGEFEIADVLSAINHKLVRRHPHVFGEAHAFDAREVEVNWDRLKERERAEPRGALEGVPSALPALARAQAIQDRAARQGFDWEDVAGVLDKVAEEIRELREARDPAQRAAELGDVLFSLVNVSRWLAVQAEDSLRQSTGKFEARYAEMERLARERGVVFRDLSLADKDALWREAKRNLAGGGG